MSDWKIDLINNKAENIKNGMMFSLTKSGEYSCCAELIDTGVLYEPGEVKRLQQEVESLVQDEILSHELNFLVNKKLSGDQNQTVRILTSLLGKSCSVRTLQSWMISRQSISSRRCPIEAVSLLKEYIQEHPMLSEQIALESSSKPHLLSSEALHQNTIDNIVWLAGSYIESKQRIAAENEALAISKIGEKLTKLEWELKLMKMEYAHSQEQFKTLNDYLAKKYADDEDFRAVQRLLSENKNCHYKLLTTIGQIESGEDFDI